MSDELNLVHEKLDNQAKRLTGIERTLQSLARQDEKLKNQETSISALWRKWDSLTDAKNGILTQIITHQASCPRKTMTNQIRALWAIVVPLSIALLATAFK